MFNYLFQLYLKMNTPLETGDCDDNFSTFSWSTSTISKEETFLQDVLVILRHSTRKSCFPGSTIKYVQIFDETQVCDPSRRGFMCTF